ncbi:hypothetical protein V1264_014219 [Littorina saxatilis]|uniref:Endonuclease/exonuclease/phosphatase domain-containing protein n=1 Tax=Littorina saxatilis TaxID=31220 RepID=A0AAN9BSG4_9CAEN
MTLCGESRKEATKPTTLLSTRKTTIGTWNVRTMYEPGKTAQVAAEMRRNNLTLLGISETRWTDAGQRRLMTGELLLYSGHEENDAHHTQGVGLMLSKQAQRSLIGWEAHGPRIITASFRTKKKRIKMHVVQCYAPTNDSEDEEKDRLYSRLQRILETYPDKDVTILMGDVNAKIGSDNTGYERVMGTHALGVMNENGERFADLCALNSLVIGGSIFPHKRIHKNTSRLFLSACLPTLSFPKLSLLPASADKRSDSPGWSSKITTAWEIDNSGCVAQAYHSWENVYFLFVTFTYRLVCVANAKRTPAERRHSDLHIDAKHDVNGFQESAPQRV